MVDIERAREDEIGMEEAGVRESRAVRTRRVAVSPGCARQARRSPCGKEVVVTK